ncbi:MAG: type II secretion system protein [Planctomycetota bacterium]
MGCGRRGGFSLIELLVVISIIALLVGVLLPTLSAVRARAIGIACASNLRQIGLGFELYLMDHDQTFPRAEFMPEPFVPQSGQPAINQALDAYLPTSDKGSQRVYTCPGDDDIAPLVAAAAEARGDAPTGVSYYYQSRLSGRTLDADSRIMRRLNSMGMSEADLLVLSDFDGSEFVFKFDEDMAALPGNVFETTSGVVDVGFFHRNRNALYADGHVAYALGN